MNRRHVDQEAARKRDVTGDACAFLAERLLGDLNDDVLSGLQHFGNQLRPARWTGMTALIATVMPWAAGTAFESRATRAPAAVVSATIPAAAAERPLETRARVAGNARGTARELFARSSSTTDARCASFARKKDHVLFDDRSFDDSSAGRGGNHFLFDMLRFVGFGFCMLFLVFLLVLGFGLSVF